MRNIPTIERSAIIHGPTKPVFGQLVRKIAFQGDDIACLITSLGHRPEKFSTFINESASMRQLKH